MTKTAGRVFGLILLTIIAISCANARTIYVSKAGDDANSGESWAAAKVTVMGGLKVAVDGDQVWVAKGSYPEGVFVNNAVEIYGGFSGSEALLTERPPFPRPNGAYSKSTVLSSGVRLTPRTSCSLRLDGFTVQPSPGGALTWGILCTGCSPVVVNSTIAGCKGYFGSGIRLERCSGLVSNNIISGNSATNGGGIYCSRSSTVIADNTIIGNHADLGSGVFCSSSSPHVTRNTITDNAPDPKVPATNQLRNVGGGIFSDHSSAPIIEGNTISRSCGGIRADGAATIIGNIISSNTDGPAVSIVNTAGAVYVTSNTIVGNTAAAGWSAGIAAKPGKADIVISNNIVAFNSSGIVDPDLTYTSLGRLILSNNCVHNPDGLDYAYVSPGLSDISADPLFVDRANGDYHLSKFSPCIDAGSNAAPALPTTDMDGEARIQHGTVDIGADESDRKAKHPHDREYRAVVLPADPSYETVACGINDQGVIVGGELYRAAVVWNNGQLTNLGYLNSSYGTRAYAVNNSGTIVGERSATSGFALNKHGLTDLGCFGEYGAVLGSAATAINNKGEVVGYSQGHGDWGDTHAFIWKDGKMTDLGTLSGGYSMAFDMNDAGRAVGLATILGPNYDYHTAIYWENGMIHDLGTFGADCSMARGVNSSGAIVGYFSRIDGDTEDRAFLWQDGQVSYLGRGEAFDINDNGMVAGIYGSLQHGWPCVWIDGVPTLLPFDDGRSGGALAINNRGEIVGWVVDSSNAMHPVLWTPISVNSR